MTKRELRRRGGKQTVKTDHDKHVIWGHLSTVLDCRWCDSTHDALVLLSMATIKLLEEAGRDKISQVFGESAMQWAADFLFGRSGTRQAARSVVRALGLKPKRRFEQGLIRLKSICDRLSFACGDPHRWQMLHGVFAELPRNRDTAELLSELEGEMAASCDLCKSSR